MKTGRVLSLIALAAFAAPSLAGEDLSGIQAISAGGNMTCALDGNGSVYCWGRWQGFGSFSRPMKIPGLLSASKVAVGYNHACAVVQGDELRCWGSGALGQLGDGTGVARRSPVKVQLDAVETVSAGGLHTCAVASPGRLFCWGANVNGALGDGTVVDRHTPTLIAAAQSWSSDLTLGGGLTLAAMPGTRSDRTCARTVLNQRYCWGRNDGAFGDGSSYPYSVTPAVMPNGWGLHSTGERLSCMTLQGVLHCAGSWAPGAGGWSDTPAPIGGYAGAVDHIALGQSTGCASNSSGVRCWGSNLFGGVGDGTTTDRAAAVPVTGLQGNVIGGLALGDHHSCALLIGGHVRCWGRNNEGQLGDGTRIDRYEQVSVLDVDGLFPDGFD